MKEEITLQEIYFDNAATTKVLESSAKIAYDIMTENYGNPSSVHGFGFKADILLKNARKDLLSALGANERNFTLTFTASGTEADNLAVIGYAKLMTKKGNRILMGNSEHPAVFECKSVLEELGYEVLLIPNSGGVIDYDFVRSNLNDKTVLITHMTVNNETGAFYDIKKLCRLRDEINPKCLIHTDAVQAFMKTEKPLAYCDADMISVSSHKIHGPKGVGALLCKKGIRLSPVVLGGGQETGLRSGTEALPLICAFANSAQELYGNCSYNLEYVRKIHEYATTKIRETLPKVVLNIPEKYTPYILSISVPKIKSEVLLRYLSEKGIYVSAGSACSSKHRENRVLTNYGISSALADSTIRISFSEFNTTGEIDTLAEEIASGIDKLAKIR